MPGLVFGSLSIPGLVMDPIQYSPWEQQQQFTKVSGLVGETGLNMLPGKRLIGIEMFLWNGFVSESALFAALTIIDNTMGQEADLGIYDPEDNLRFTLASCMLQPLEYRFHRQDFMHGWYARVKISFAQLKIGA